jgi:integrase
MASISKIEGAWRVQIRRKGFASITKRFPTKAQAQSWARDIEGQLLAGVAPIPARVSQATVGQLVERYIKLRASTRPIADTTTEHYTLRQLKANLGELVAARLSVADLLGWATMRQDAGAGPYTINCDLSKLGTVLRYAGEGLPDVVAAARPKLLHFGLIGGGGLRERRPTPDELVRIEAWLAAERGLVYSDAVRFAALTAMRRGEIVRLAWADLDHDKRMVLIRDRKDPRHKAGNDQWVPLLGEAWALALRQPRDQPQASELIWPIHPQTLSKYFLECCRALSIPDLHFHDLRHEGISALFEQGFDIPQVAIVSGHKDWRHLRRYTQIKPESLHAPRPSPAPGSRPGE